MFYMIEERVGRGFYFTLPGIFETKESAEAQIARERSNDNMRAQAYQRSGGWSGGPQRYHDPEPDRD